MAWKSSNDQGWWRPRETALSIFFVGCSSEAWRGLVFCGWSDVELISFLLQNSKRFHGCPTSFGFLDREDWSDFRGFRIAGGTVAAAGPVSDLTATSAFIPLSSATMSRKGAEFLGGTSAQTLRLKSVLVSVELKFFDKLQPGTEQIN